MAKDGQSRRARRSRRYREVVRVLWDERLFTIIRAAGMEKDAPGPVHTTSEEATASAVEGGAEPAGGKHASPEVRLRRGLERLGPTFIKIGQMLSTRRDLVPPAVADELAKLQDEVPSVSWEEMEQILREELGGSADEFFAEFGTDPMAAASIGQVYRARLHDGRPVAVKIQRPDARQVIETDLDILLSQARFVAQHSEWARALGVPAVAEDMAQVLRAELDYAHEARSMLTFHEAFDGSDEVFFPAPLMDLTTDRVLTMELVKGIPGSHLEELRAAEIDTERMVQRGVDCYFRQIFEMGTYHADPHAGNLVAMRDGRVGFVDFGRVGVISRQHRSAVFDILIAVMEDDPADATQALLSMSTVDPGLDVAELQADIGRVTTLYRESQHRPDVLQVTLLETLAAMRKHRIDVSSEVVQLLTTLGVLEGVASQLHPGFSVIEAAKPFALRLLVKSFGPRAWADESLHALRRYRRLLEELPKSLSRVLRRAADGEFRLGVRPEGFEDVLRGLREMVDRLALSILVAAFVLAFAYIAAQGGLSDWIRWIAGGVLVFSALIAMWLLVSIVAATRRRR